MPDLDAKSPIFGCKNVGDIPVRNLWLLMLYASDLARVRGNFNALLEDYEFEIPDLVAQLLADAVERRLRRNISRGYRNREDAIKRVRGRIDILTTESRQLLSRGEVFCRYQELTIDTPRNKLIRAALSILGRIVNDERLSCRCRALAAVLAQAGVSSGRPTRAQLASDQIGRNDANDHLIVTLSRLAFDLALPTELAGTTPFLAPDREETWVRRLFEKATLGFARVEFEPLGWSVRGSTPIEWQTTGATDGLGRILPRMITDIILDNPKNGGCRMVIDTKFTSILTKGRFGRESIKSGYLYQMYAYLRSQEGIDPLWDRASGMFLHPAIDRTLREFVTIQNHNIYFGTVDLSSSPNVIRNELRALLNGESFACADNLI